MDARRLASPFRRQRRVHGTARYHLAVPVAHPRGCGWPRHCALALAASGADSGAVPTNFLLLLPGAFSPVCFRRYGPTDRRIPRASFVTPDNYM